MAVGHCEFLTLISGLHISAYVPGRFTREKWNPKTGQTPFQHVDVEDKNHIHEFIIRLLAGVTHLEASHGPQPVCP